MTNEELLGQLLEEVRRLRIDVDRLRSTINSQNETIQDLRTYIGNNTNNNILNNATDEEVENAVNDVVYGDVQANAGEPKDIILSNKNVDDKMVYGTDEANYYKKMNEKVAKEFIDKAADKEKTSEEDRSKYISGTNILKPRNRGLFESDEDYEKYLEEYYGEAFKSESKGLANLKEKEPKGLALLDDVKKIDEIEDLKNAINGVSVKNEKGKVNDDESEYSGIEALEIDDSRDIYSDSSKKIKSIASEIEKEKNKENNKDNKSEVIEFVSDEEREAFEKSQTVDYAKDKNSKTKKIGKMRKAARSFKDIFKKHGKKIIAGILVATAAISAAISAKSCTYDKTNDLNENKDNTKSNVEDFNFEIPSKKVADNLGVNTDEIIDKIAEKNDSENKEDDGMKIESNSKYATSDETFDIDKLEIGDSVNFNGDYIYRTAADSVNDTNRFIPDNPKTDAREISAIEYVSPNGKQHMTAITEKEQKQLEGMGWKAESYNMKNNTRSSDTYELKYEGWVEPSDLTEVKSK